MKRYLTLGCALIVFWLLLSGHYTPLFMGFAAVSILLVMGVSVRMDQVDHEIDPVRLTPALVSYWIYLAWETVRSNVDMVKRVWRKEVNVAPAVARIKTSQKSRMGKVIYANSITLTPGTVTLDIDEEKQEFEVHSIDYALLRELEDGDMDRRITRLEK
ncbi:MAG: Na+/H+ antiporter subunit E [Ketobacteraceae bacterium]|nr:Na+/H+ antiporter subunit E [Ketobacteraceae bacterium]